jgi:hypothetical protein
MQATGNVLGKWPNDRKNVDIFMILNSYGWPNLRHSNIFVHCTQEKHPNTFLGMNGKLMEDMSLQKKCPSECAVSG